MALPTRSPGFGEVNWRTRSVPVRQKVFHCIGYVPRRDGSWAFMYWNLRWVIGIEAFYFYKTAAFRI